MVFSHKNHALRITFQIFINNTFGCSFLMHELKYLEIITFVKYVLCLSNMWVALSVSVIGTDIYSFKNKDI